MTHQLEPDKRKELQMKAFSNSKASNRLDQPTLIDSIHKHICWCHQYAICMFFNDTLLGFCNTSFKRSSFPSLKWQVIPIALKSAQYIIHSRNYGQALQNCPENGTTAYQSLAA